MATNAESVAGPADPGRLLSARELEVLTLTSRGLTNAGIADRLGITVHAVKFHLAAVYRKLKVANRTEATVCLLESQWNAGEARSAG